MYPSTPNYAYGESYNSSFFFKNNYSCSKNIEFHSSFCYDGLNYTKDKEFKNMSFGGIIYFEQNIIGFADQKSTMMVAPGWYEEDVYRPRTQKLFWNKDFIIAFLGTNCFHTSENGVLKRNYVEDWIKNNIGSCKTPMELCQKLYSYFKTIQLSRFDAIIAYAGYYADEGETRPVCCSAEINPIACKIEIAEVLVPHANYGGVNEFNHYFAANESSFITDDTNKILCSLKEAETKISPGIRYCAAGGAWTVRKFFPEK